MTASLPENRIARSANGRGIPRWLSASLGGLLLAALAACNGSAVVTLTSTPSTDTYLAYRVGLVSVQLRTSSGSSSVNVLPAGTTVDLARLVNLSEVVGSSSSVKSGTFKQAVVTLDYTSAQIIYDNGSPEGVALTPLGAGGQALGRMSLTLLLDPSNELSIAAKSTTRLSLNFNLAASNVVNLTAKTVAVMPMMSASSQPIDAKTVRIRGPIGSVNNTSDTDTWFSTGITPFDFSTAEGGSLRVTPTTGTSYEINGTPVSGTSGLTQLASLSSGTMVEAFGTMTTSTTTSNSLFNEDTGTPTETCSDGTTPETLNGVLTCTDGSTLESTSTTASSETCSDGTVPESINGVLSCTDGSTLESTGTGTGTGTITTVSFSATQVLAGSSVQGGGFDRVSGIVTGRSGNTFTIDDATLLTNGGTNTLVFGTTTVTVGPNTQVTQLGEGTTDTNGIAQISVGSLVYAFGTAGSVGTTSATLDASAGRVRVGQTVASGLVNAQGSGGTTLTLNLAQLGGRAASAFDFAGTGSTAGNDATAGAYVVSTGTADLANAGNGEPVQVTGYPALFGSASSSGDFLEQSGFLDYTTINAVLVLDWTGTSAPFTSYNTAQIQLDAQNVGIGTRHMIQIGAQTFNIVGIGTDPIIEPSQSGTNTVFTIGHSVSGSYENFNTFSSFITQLQTELTGSVVATGITAVGQYASSSYTFSASSITLSLDN